MYHGVAQQSAQSLDEQLRYLIRHFKVVSLEAMLDRLANGSVPLAHEIVLTFDDGLRNNLTVVYPILRESAAAGDDVCLPRVGGIRAVALEP